MPIDKLIPVGLNLFKPLLRSRAAKEYWQPREWPKLEAKRIAMVACHSIRNTFWATQALGWLQRRFSRSELFAITRPDAEDLWNGWLMPDRIVCAPEVVGDARSEETHWIALANRAKQLRSRGFDLAIDLTGSRASAFLCFWMRPGCSIGFGGDDLAWMYSHVVSVAEHDHHASEEPFRVIRPLMGAEAPAIPSIPRPPMPTCPLDQISREVGIKGPPFFILVPGADVKESIWSSDSFVRAGKLLAEKGQVIIVGSPDQAGLCQRVAHSVTNAKVCLAPVGRAAALLQACNGVLSNDSGLAHLAAAYGRNVVVILKETDPALSTTPLGPQGRVHSFKAHDRVEVVTAPLLTD